ncbi:MAG TPA: hypothetical protein VG013_29425 [Gemmataceae bacterium]|jgi:hypothetical protein|nr:hypothetical protein [Gemmataceae bacterium]
MSWDEHGPAQRTARPANRLPEPPPALPPLPVVLRVPRFAGLQKLRSVPHPGSRGGGATGKLLAFVVLCAAVLLLLRWHAWLVSPDPQHSPAAAAAEEVQTLPPLGPVPGAPVPGPARTPTPRNNPARPSAGPARLAPLIVPLETGGAR